MDEFIKSFEKYFKEWMREVLKEKPYSSEFSKPALPYTWTKFVKIEEASLITCFSIGTLYNLVNKNKIPFHKVGRSIRFDPEELQLWMKKDRPEIVKLGIRKLKEE